MEKSFLGNKENIEDSNSFTNNNSSLSFNSLRKSEKNISTSNDCLSDIEIDEEEGFVVNKLNLERFKKVEKNNLSILFDNFDAMLGLDQD